MGLNITFKDTKTLYDYIRKSIDYSQEKYVSDVLKMTLKRHIKDDVYNAYIPEMYWRRGQYDGLADEDLIEFEVVDGTLSMWSEARENENYLPNNRSQAGWLAPDIEYGINYDYKNIGARPFMANTIEELEKTQQHIQAMKYGLEKCGFDVK